ncbi:DUF11 domain-containing protein [Candidatus Woesearchaeota archaeon]|nr:DUF11 domain-containing protein [Candidatus Woesearchaeota archaeon]
MKQNFVKATLLFISSLLLLLTLCCFAQAKDLYNDWHYSGDTFSVEGDVYTITHYDIEDTSVIVGINKNSYIIKEGECKVTGIRETCIEEIFRDVLNAEDGDHIKFVEGRAYAGISILVKTYGPDITVTRTFSDDTPELNGEVTVSVVLKNTGSDGTDSLSYFEEYPEGIEILSSSSGTTRSLKSISYSGNLASESEKTFTYTFKVTGYLDFSNSAIVNHTYQGKSYGLKSSSQSVKVIKPYTFSASISPSSIEASEQTAISLRVENDVSVDINVTELKITIPSYITLQSLPGELEKKNDKYSWKGIIKPDNYKMINLLLKPVKSGRYNFLVELRLLDSEGKVFSETKNLSLTSNIQPIDPILSVLETSVSEGGIFRIAFSVNNPNKIVGFRNIKAKVTSTFLPDLTAELAELMPEATKTIIVNDSLEAPFVDNKVTYDIIASGSYETSTSENRNFSEKVSFTVTPVADAISISQSADTQELVAGNNVTITIKITNNNQESIKVTVRDEYTRGATLGGGMTSTSETMLFDRAETRQAYTYKLFIPEDFNNTELMIKTFAGIEAKNFLVSKNLTIKVKPAEKKQETNIPQQEQPEPEPPKQEPVKKEGFFAKVIKEISAFFNRLFGKKS